MPNLRRCLLLLALALAAPAWAQAPGSSEFAAGVAAYRAGDPAAALRHFERARALGDDSPQLHFNLGLTYYQLRRLPEARAQFEALRRDPGYEGIADFHLALVAARAGDRERAEAMWRALERGPDAALAQRARAALARLEAARAPFPATGYLLAGAGYDSNPALLDESVQPAGAGASAGVELFGAFGTPLSGTARAATVLRGGAYLKDYAEDNGADQRGLFAGISRERDDGTRRLGYGIEASASDYDGEPFQRMVGVQASRSPHAGSGWRLGAQLGRITAADAYAHLEGWRARAGVARLFQAGGAQARAGYDVEYNDREDLDTGNEFFSHSPLRQRLEAVVEHPAGARTSLRWTARYRDSRYRDPDRYRDGAVPREERRHERLAQAGLQLRRRLGREAFALLELQYSRNAATPAAFDYDRGVVLLGLEWVPVARAR